MDSDDYCGVSDEGIATVDSTDVYMSYSLAADSKKTNARCLYQFNVTSENDTVNFGVYVKTLADYDNTYIYEYGFNTEKEEYFIKYRLRQGDIMLLEKGIKKQITIQYIGAATKVELIYGDLGYY